VRAVRNPTPAIAMRYVQSKAWVLMIEGGLAAQSDAHHHSCGRRNGIPRGTTVNRVQPVGVVIC